MDYAKITMRAAAVAMIASAAYAVPVVAAQHAEAQSANVTNAIPQSEEVVLQAKIRKIDVATRKVWLKGADGQKVTVIAGPLVRLNLLKAGDTVNVKYYRSVAFMVNGPAGGTGTPVTDDQMSAAVVQRAQAPGGIAVGLVKIQGTVVGVNLASNTINIVNPSGGQIYTLDVTDPARQAMLSSLNVGDTISAVISQTLAVTITPAPKHWW